MKELEALSHDTFVPWPKTPRFFREAVLTEKLDGTSCHVAISEVPADYDVEDPANVGIWLRNGLLVRAASRSRWISPGKTTDNYGFAAWVLQHVEELTALGVGRHYGEFWGGGIQRGYGLAKDDKRFSLFNVQRWVKPRTDGPTPALEGQYPCPDCCHVVPVLYRGEFNTVEVNLQLASLRTLGSKAAPGYMKPEGLIVFHTAAQRYFKVLLENDDQPKGATE